MPVDGVVSSSCWGLAMRITKLGHSCVRLEKDGAVLVIDPGVWTDADAALAGAAAVMVTHGHGPPRRRRPQSPTFASRTP